jgi:hypothetical protein
MTLCQTRYVAISLDFTDEPPGKTLAAVAHLDVRPLPSQAGHGFAISGMGLKQQASIRAPLMDYFATLWDGASMPVTLVATRDEHHGLALLRLGARQPAPSTSKQRRIFRWGYAESFNEQIITLEEAAAILDIDGPGLSDWQPDRLINRCISAALFDAAAAETAAAAPKRKALENTRKAFSTNLKGAQSEVVPVFWTGC